VNDFSELDLEYLGILDRPIERETALEISSPFP
jgi:hypothetical protein